MRPETVRQDERLWRSLHWVLALIIPLLILFLLSCVRAKEEPENLGPSIDPKAVQDVLNEALEGNTYVNSAKDQYVYYEENISAQGGVFQDRGSTFVYVKDAMDNPDDPNLLKITMYYERRELNEDGEFVTTKSDEIFNWQKDRVTSNGTVFGDSRALMAKAIASIKGQGTVSTRAKQIVRETYHNFSVQRGDVYPVPDAVKARTDCGGLTGCKYNAIYMKLDQVLWYSETEYDKYHYDLIFNKTTPFLFNLKNDQMGGLLVLRCISTYIPYDGRKIYIRDCIQLKDFQK